MVTPVVADMNHANPVDFGRIAQNGIVGVIHKAVQGVGFSDPAYASRRQQAAAANLCWAAYAFNTGDVVSAQVAHFLAVAQPDNATGMWLDFEDNTASEMSLAQAQDFLDRVDQAIGRACGIYSGNRIKQLIVGANSATRDFFAQHPLWLCEYGPVARMVDVNRQPLPWSNWFIWQYTGDGVGPEPQTVPGLQKGADLSTFNGTPDQLRAAWPLPSLSAAPTPIATPQPAPVSVGTGTAWVQESLNKLGIADPPLVVDGNSGRLTRAAVEAFQKKAGIAADGLVGPETIAAIEKALG